MAPITFLLLLTVLVSLIQNCNSANQRTWTVGLTLGGTDNKYNGEYVDITGNVFNKLFRESKYHIIKRECASCPEPFKNIYYRRLNVDNINSFDAYENMKSWRRAYNDMDKKDFMLTSELSRAIDKSESGSWVFCNYDDPPVGAFRDCGPHGAVGGLWTADVINRWHHGWRPPSRFLIYTPDINCMLEEETKVVVQEETKVVVQSSGTANCPAFNDGTKVSQLCGRWWGRCNQNLPGNAGGLYCDLDNSLENMPTCESFRSGSSNKYDAYVAGCPNNSNTFGSPNSYLQISQLWMIIIGLVAVIFVENVILLWRNCCVIIKGRQYYHVKTVDSETEFE